MGKVICDIGLVVFVAMACVGKGLVVIAMVCLLMWGWVCALGFRGKGLGAWVRACLWWVLLGEMGTGTETRNMLVG